MQPLHHQIIHAPHAESCHDAFADKRIEASPDRAICVPLMVWVVAGKRLSSVMKLGVGKEKVVFIGVVPQPCVILKRVDVVNGCQGECRRRRRCLGHQNRWPKELAAAGITDMDAANVYLQDKPKPDKSMCC